MRPTSPGSPQAAQPPWGNPDLDRQVRQAQAEMIFDRSRSSNLIGIPVALLVCAVLWEAVPHVWLLAWLAAKVGVTLWRVAITRRFDRDRQQPTRVLHWEGWFIVALAADGLVFGLLGTWLLPTQDRVLAAVMVATLLGISAVALVVLSMSLRASVALTAPVLVPALLWQLMQADRVSLYLAAGMAVFMGLVLVEGRRAAAHTAAMLRLQFSADELAAQRQQALAQAERSSAVKTRFLATMSHEMRTPLHGILGLARLLRADAPAHQALPQQQDRLLTLERTGEHLLGLINDVLDYSKIETGAVRLQPEPVDLHALLQSVAELTRVSAAEKSLGLHVQIQLPAPCWVQGDPARLRQVLLNLLGNATKFTAQGGITLQAQALPQSRVRIDVIDTGPGVTEADRERIFEAFEQLDGSYARRHGGTGLGLTISRELAQAMGGDLQCSAAPDGGAQFTLVLPLPPVPAPQAEASLPSPVRLSLHTPASGRQGHVLLAEDNPVNALVAQALLERLGLRVTAVTDGLQAVQALHTADADTHGYDLVLMDCQMPDLDGFEATARIRAHEHTRGSARVPIVALTANALEGDRERSLAAGMDGHLAKPFKDEDLVAVLRQHLPR
jgi:signal transduction histidine kinase/CheY-like chemotaxis protein